MKVHLLNMGGRRYGDCIVVEDNGVLILVDGGHASDYRSSPEAASIPAQLGAILGREPPFKFDLLVITHCHTDHIGCLPRLVSDGTVLADRALVAHDQLGFPSDSSADAEPDVRAIVAALREEPLPAFASDADIEAFVSDAASAADRYRAMLAALENAGTKVIRFAGVDAAETQKELEALEKSFSGMGLKILGPTEAHLLRCTEVIAGAADAATDMVANLRRADGANIATIYRQLAGATNREADTADGGNPSAALNNQSIVLKVGRRKNAALLTGDMQFAGPQVSSIADDMSELLDAVRDDRPYAFAKIPHHGSHNAFDEDVADAIRAKVYGVTTGSGDAGHPHEEVLALLERLEEVRFVRTDRNGGVTIDLANGQQSIAVEADEVNNFEVNDVVLPPAPLPPAGPNEGQLPVAPAGAPAAPAIEITRISGARDVEVRARIPHVATKVTITIDIEPKGPVGPAPEVPDDDEDGPLPRLAAGRALPPLLFVTHFPSLVANVGRLEARRVERMLNNAGQFLLKVGNAGNPFPEVRQALAARQPVGVVVIGGYDVLKSSRLDALPPAVRAQVGGNDDHDDFVVWSDHLYGDRDGDGLAEVPVSRIPDGRSGALLMTALSAGAVAPRRQRFGLRNVARPFADRIFGALRGSEAILISKPTGHAAVVAADVNAPLIYIMLHGSNWDTSRFWGEDGGNGLEAMNVASIPNPCGGVVLSGCCWGALAVRTIARDYVAGSPIAALGPAESMALGFIARGALAFVGCTGSHYSGPGARLNHYGPPMHEAFWRHHQAGKAPARALFDAKVDYIAAMPHGLTDIDDQAIEYKILNQFTCLGLGW